MKVIKKEYSGHLIAEGDDGFCYGVHCMLFPSIRKEEYQTYNSDNKPLGMKEYTYGEGKPLDFISDIDTIQEKYNGKKAIIKIEIIIEDE